jgi:CubicO group peptidase (beta-lactamase class C family)
MRIAAWTIATLALCVLWAALALFGTLGGWTKTPLAPAGDIDHFVAAVRARAAEHAQGSLALRIVEDGTAYDDFTAHGDSVGPDTLHQVASLSKWISAWGVMKLVETGRLDLDAPVSRYLTRWSLPPSDFDNDGVTVRRLLSHTAGLTDGLGYDGFAAGVEVQRLEASLTRAADGGADRDGRTRVGIAPGSEWRYSGGGYTLLQLLVEEVTGVSFAEFMGAEILAPLGMTRSTFDPDTATPIAAFYDTTGAIMPARRYTALAAASLYTTIDDIARFVAAHVPGPAGEPVGRGVLRPDTVARMREPTAFQYGVAIWGLGTVLYAPKGDGGFIIGHDGSNVPAINTAARVDPATGDAIIVFASGNPLLATSIAGEWTFWKTGGLDVLAFSMALPTLLVVIGSGWIVIVGGAVLLAWRSRRMRLRRPKST